MIVPAHPKLFHILHVDRLASVVADGGLRCDAEMVQRGSVGTAIGMEEIKQRRLSELTLTTHPGLYVGRCVPFYFCPQSIMLYVIFRKNHPGLKYTGGQQPIIHLQADLHRVVAWATANGRRWAFTLSNAGTYYFEDRNDLAQLHELDWDAIQAKDWRGKKEGKQAEFLLEHYFPWHLVERIGVMDNRIHTRVTHSLVGAAHRPPVEIKRDWYY